MANNREGIDTLSIVRLACFSSCPDSVLRYVTISLTKLCRCTQAREQSNFLSPLRGVRLSFYYNITATEPKQCSCVHLHLENPVRIREMIQSSQLITWNNQEMSTKQLELGICPHLCAGWKDLFSTLFSCCKIPNQRIAQH